MEVVRGCSFQSLIGIFVFCGMCASGNCRLSVHVSIPDRDFCVLRLSRCKGN